jgi:hypothetical protein
MREEPKELSAKREEPKATERSEEPKATERSEEPEELSTRSVRRAGEGPSW